MTLPGPALDIVRQLALRFVRDGGALLAIDYGHVRPGFGDTLQAVAGHRFADPLATPGEADLTTHVDFAALARAATSVGGRVHGPVDQRDFLLRLGLRERAARLSVDAGQTDVERIAAAVERLIDPTQTGMGRSFKVAGLSNPNMETLVAI